MSKPPPDSGDWTFDPALTHLHYQIDAQLRAEARENEVVMTASELQGRTFADIANEARNRGDVVAVSTPQRSFSGLVLAAVNDFITLKTSAFVVDVNVEAIAHLRVIGHSRTGGTPALESAGTFEMRVAERGQSDKRLEFGFGTLKHGPVGKVRAVGQDHVMVLDDDGQEWYLPTRSIAYVILLPPLSRDPLHWEDPYR